MKITQLRDKDKTTALTTMDMETWIGKTRTETKTRPVSAFREVLRYSLPDSRCYEADKLPKILPAAEFRRAEGGKQMKSYNGIVELTVGPLSGGPEITLVKQLAWEQPQTHCVFTGSSGRTVKIWAKFTRPDNSLLHRKEKKRRYFTHMPIVWPLNAISRKSRSAFYPKSLVWNSTHGYHTTRNLCTDRIPFRFICRNRQGCPKN